VGSREHNVSLSVLEHAVNAQIDLAYKELSLPLDDSVVGRVYRRLSVKHHPDKGGKPEAFKAIQEFYESIQEESNGNYSL